MRGHSLRARFRPGGPVYDLWEAIAWCAVLGHEAVGTVEAVGAAVTTVKTEVYRPGRAAFAAVTIFYHRVKGYG